MRGLRNSVTRYHCLSAFLLYLIPSTVASFKICLFRPISPRSQFGYQIAQPKAGSNHRLHRSSSRIRHQDAPVEAHQAIRDTRLPRKRSGLQEASDWPFASQPQSQAPTPSPGCPHLRRRNGRSDLHLRKPTTSRKVHPVEISQVCVRVYRSLRWSASRGSSRILRVAFRTLSS
jgi:hypothetical protein